MKELAVWMICLVAAAIGPYILIEARFSMGFILTSLLALSAYLFVYHQIIKIIPKTVATITVIPIYAFWVYLFLTLGREVSIQHYAANLFTLDWSRLTGVDGLFQFPTLHMLWYVIIVIDILLYRKPYFQRIMVSSFRYWAMLTIGLALAKMTTNSEASVIVLNVALLYAFLQQFLPTVAFSKMSFEKI